MSGSTKTLYAFIIAVTILLTGCSSSSMTGYASVSYGGYYDPYPYWGYGGGTVIVNPPDRPDRPDRPETLPETRPPAANPPSTRPATRPTTRPSGGIGRPMPRGGGGRRR